MLVPVILTLIFVIASILLMLVLTWAAWRHRNPPVLRSDPEKELKDFGPAQTNRWLRGLRVFFLLLILVVFGFHSYWVFWAASNKDSHFNKAKRFDARKSKTCREQFEGLGARPLGQARECADQISIRCRRNYPRVSTGSGGGSSHRLFGFHLRRRRDGIGVSKLADRTDQRLQPAKLTQSGRKRSESID